MRDELGAFIAGAVLGVIGAFVAIVLALDVVPRQNMEREAVENTSAEYCIEDHEKVFRWNGCEGGGQ